MKRFFLVEADTTYLSLFAYELQRVDADNFRRIPDALFNNVNREQFFGNLNALCVSHSEPNNPPLPLKSPENFVNKPSESEVE